MRCFRHDIRFPKIAMLVLLAAIAAGIACEKQSVYIPYQPQPQPQQSSVPRAAFSPGAPEVEEHSLVNLGGSRTIIHEVGPLETLWRISRMYDVTPDAIYSANGLRPSDSLRVGQKLVIPNARLLRHVINLYRNTQWCYIIVHHTATEMGNARVINSSHGARGFWNGLGYHFLIDNGTFGKGDGQIEMSPRWIRQQVGAHCKAGGMNDKAIGVALVGNFNNESPTPNQLQSLSYLIKTLCNYYRIPSANVLGHNEVPGAATQCPGARFSVGNIRHLSYPR